MAFIFSGVALLLIWAYLEFAVVSIGDGHFELAMNIDSPQGKSIQSVSYSASNNLDYFEWLIRGGSEVDDLEFDRAPENDRRFMASIYCSSKTNGYGRETKYVEPRYLALRVTYTDGTTARQIATIPSGRGKRAMHVTIPE